MAYVKCFDQNLNPIGQPIHDITLRQARRRINTADQASFSLSHDIEGVEQLGLATYVSVYDRYDQCATGFIQSRDLAGDEYSFSVQGHAHRMKGFKTPTKWQAWNGKDLADVVRDHTKRFQFKRWNTKADWETAIRYQVDIDIEPGSVILEYEPHPEDPENERPKAWGYIQFRVDLGDDALSTGRTLRWTEIIDAYVRITVQSRSATTSAGLDSASWGPEMTAINVGDVQENEVSGVPIAGTGRWVDIRINLYTEDQESVRKDSYGEVVGYGFTPYLDGVELIWREPTFLHAGDIPDTTGVIVQGFEFERVDFLQSLANICDEYGWEFRVRHDEEQKKIFLDLGENSEATMGQDRSIGSNNPIVLEHGRNIAITVLRDSQTKLANVLDCFGAGEGTKQLYIQLKDEQSIKDNGEIPGDFVFPEAETIAQLIQAGQKELEKRSQPDVAFEVSIPVDDIRELEGVGLGDTITVVHPRNKVVVNARIMDESFQSSRSERRVRWGLNDFLYNPMEQLLGRRPSSRTLGDIPDVPKQVTAHPNFGYIVVTWTSNADSWAVRARTESGQWRYFDTKTPSFTHQQLEVDSVWEYQVAAIQNQRISSWSESVWATVAELPVDDKTPPEPATDLVASEITRVSNDGVVTLAVELVWNKSVSEHAHQQFVERAEGAGPFMPLTTLDKGSEVYHDTQGLQEGITYTWRVTTISKAGMYAEDNPTATLTLSGKNTLPGAPTGLIVSIDEDGNVVLNWNMVVMPDLKEYVIEIASDSAFTQGAERYYSLSNTFHLTGMFADRTVYARVFARDRSGKTGPPSNTVVINIPKLLSTRVAAMYLAQQTYQKLLDNFFFGTDDSYFDGRTLKPSTVETQHLAVGAGTRNFQLVGVKMDANTDDTRGKFSNTAGYLILATAVGEDTKAWNISAKTQQLTLGQQYYVYARCSKSTTTGEIAFSTSRPAIETTSYHNFLIGMYFTDESPAVLAVSYGFTYINGSHITTGTIDVNKVRILASGTGASAIEISGVGIVFRDTSGNISIQMSTQTGDAYFRGTVEAEAIILPIKPY